MDELRPAHSRGLDPETLRQLLAEDAEREQAAEFRRFFITRLALMAFAVWLLSWPIHLLPHTVLWVFLAIVALLIGLTSTPRTDRAIRNRLPKQSR